MKLMLVFCIASMAASAPSKTDESGNYGNIVSINMLTNPVGKGNYGGDNSSNNSGNLDGNYGTMNILADLKHEVRNLGDKLVEAIAESQQSSCVVNESLTCEKSVVNATETPTPKNSYRPDHVLIDSCDDPSTPNSAANIDWWATPKDTTGDKAFFVVDLGCSRCVSKVKVRNSGHGFDANRGTKEFLVSLATESDLDNWKPVVKGKLADVRGVKCEDQPGKKIFAFEAVQARYARFEAISYYGNGANLQYFDIY